MNNAVVYGGHNMIRLVEMNDKDEVDDEFFSDLTDEQMGLVCDVGVGMPVEPTEEFPLEQSIKMTNDQFKKYIAGYFGPRRREVWSNEGETIRVLTDVPLTFTEDEFRELFEEQFTEDEMMPISDVPWEGAFVDGPDDPFEDNANVERTEQTFHEYINELRTWAHTVLE